MASSGNFPLWSPLIKGATNLSLGNTRFDGTTNSRSAVLPINIPIGTKFYIECLVKQMTNYNIVFGLVSPYQDIATYLESQSTVNGMIFHGYSSGDWRTNPLVNGSRQGFNALSDDSTSARVLAMTINRVDNEIKMYIDNTLITNGTISISATDDYTVFASFTGGSQSGVHMNINCGHDSTGAGDFSAGSGVDENGFGNFQNTPPSGFLALTSSNLPISDDIDPAQTNDDYVGGKQFNAVTWTGDGNNSRSISVGFQPDLIWFKSRSSAFSHRIYDTSRGINSNGGKRLFSNTDGAEVDQTSGQDISAVGTDGFTTGASSNLYTNDTNSGGLQVAWCWRANGGTTASNSSGDITSTVQANTKGGFSIVTYTGNGSSAQSIGHSLSAVPKFIIVKNRSQGDAWAVYHVGMGNSAHLILNENGQQTTSSAYWGSFTPTTTLFKVGSDHKLNASGENYVAYVWANVQSFSSFGKYIGNGGSGGQGTFVYTGFKPRLVFLRRIDGSGSWLVSDSARRPVNDGNYLEMYWNSSAEDQTGADTHDGVDYLSNGFQLKATNLGANGNGNEYIYGAWGDVPTRYGNTF